MNTSGLRRAALLVAGMHRSDRRWIRRQLSSRTWRAIKSAMSELRRVAQTDRRLIAQALPSAEAKPAPEPPSPDVLMAGLEGLSTEWAALVIKACAPDHSAMYEAHVGHGDAMEAEIARIPAVPPALANNLAEAVRRRGQEAIAGVRS